jgi:predicted ATP-dependent protease
MPKKNEDDAKKITIKDFIPVIPFEQIKDVLRFKLGKREGNKEYNKFMKWMNGQTVMAGGVFPCDLERFLKGLPCID